MNCTSCSICRWTVVYSTVYCRSFLTYDDAQRVVADKEEGEVRDGSSSPDGQEAAGVRGGGGQSEAPVEDASGRRGQQHQREEGPVGRREAGQDDRLVPVARGWRRGRRRRPQIGGGRVHVGVRLLLLLLLSSEQGRGGQLGGRRRGQQSRRQETEKDDGRRHLIGIPGTSAMSRSGFGHLHFGGLLSCQFRV